MRKISFQSLLPVIAFCALLIWGWRITNPFNYIPSYDDALEVIWGIEYYHQALYKNHTSPLFTDLVFHPDGFYTGALAHTPALFLLAQPLRLIGGAAFAYNVLILSSQVVIFVGAYRFLRLYANDYSALIAALMLSFWNFRWFRMGGHVHTLWSTALLVWIAYFLVLWRNHQISDKKISILSGLLWGLMINFSLYSIFIGGWSILLLGGKRGIKNFIVSAFIALLLGSGTILSYYLSASQNEISNFGYSHLVYWGASLRACYEL